MDISAGAGDSWTNETIFEFLRIYEKHRPLLSTYRPSNVFEIIAKDLAESCNFHVPFLYCSSNPIPTNVH